MKTKFLALMTMGVSALTSQAFTIDFNALDVPLGTTVTSTSPLTVNVAGYGDVKFEVASPDVLVVASNYQNDSGTFMNSLEFDPGESVLVTFLGPLALNVDFDIIGISAGESANPVPIGFDGDEYQLDVIGGNGVGIAAISWNAVPEPSSSLLVLLGAGSLIMRRRRD
ncbi:MAG: PEP-CTERM sorting domain-containing protein [Verrucomicrobiae bacterium]|nr:PEP-CTERM sorting domain-containing protein [Verrucomicrobiae bacterium]NNJ86603.1 PEP-CTERM sorting domain-containing protein [Akkermansiaceae bacterium]